MKLEDIKQLEEDINTVKTELGVEDGFDAIQYLELMGWDIPSWIKDKEYNEQHPVLKFVLGKFPKEDESI